MKKTLMCVGTIFVFFVAAAVAQTATNPQGTQGTQSASPSMTQETNPGSTPGAMPGDNTSNSTGNMKSEKKIKGCIESEGGQYVLRTRRGKDIQLTGEDVSAHSGHEVTVHGMWASGMSGMSNTSAGTSGSAASGKSFNVTSLDMISETCNLGKGKNAGMSNNSTTGSPTTPPQ
ncbi:MAG: DUF5818 domain-containing protein [Terriglobales bacterium]